MLVFEAIWAEAAIVFGKRNGAAESLTPFSRTWKQILGRSEHALWTWNEKYGPLNAPQREYATSLIVHSLKKASEAPSLGMRYAFFNAKLTGLLNHETVHAGFQSRKDEAKADAQYDSLMYGLYEEVAA
jgi:hypothetical protein